MFSDSCMCLFSTRLYHLWLIRHGWSRKVHCVSHGNVLFVLSEVAERKGCAQGFGRLHLAPDPCNNNVFSSAGCLQEKHNNSGEQNLVCDTILFPSRPHCLFGLILAWKLGMVCPVSSHCPTFWLSMKLSEELAKGRLAIQETGLGFGVGMGQLRGSH